MSTAGTGATAAAAIEQMRRQYTPEGGADGATLLLTLTGEGGGTWLLRAGDELEAEPAGEASAAAAARVEMDVATLQQLLAGQANRFDAVLDGRIRVHGDLEEAARLSWAFHRADQS